MPIANLDNNTYVLSGWAKTDSSKDWFYAPFHGDISDWQYVSLTVLQDAILALAGAWHNEVSAVRRRLFSFCAIFLALYALFVDSCGNMAILYAIQG